MDDSELINIFWTEVRDYLERMNALIMALEMSVPEDDAGGFVERLRELNRLAHSMKGAARAVGIPEVETLGHHMEDIFEASLKRGLALTPEICDLIYDALDLVGQRADGESIPPETIEAVQAGMIAAVAEEELAGADVVYIPGENTDDGTPGSTTTNGRHQSDEFPVVTGTDAPDDNSSREDTPPLPATADTDTPNFPLQPPPTPRANLQTMTTLMRPAEDTVRVSIAKLDKLMAASSELLVTQLQSEERKADVKALGGRYSRWAKSWRGVRAAYIRLARRLQAEEASEDLRLLFEFLETNQKFLQDTARDVNALSNTMANDAMRLATLTDALQDNIGSLRLVPFETVLGTLQRTLRDATRQTGKEAYLDVVGAGTEIDKTVLEHLKDPLMHLIRNAVDHGIESATEREAVGKPPAGWVFLTVETRGSEIVIRVGDDGRGVHADAVRKAAIERGIVTAGAAAAMSDEDAKMLVFHPGLTTRTHVSPISGRGVGMDVVRSAVESLRGRVSVDSVPGRGTTFTMSVPVSLTRIRSVMLRLGTEHYAVPALAVQRMERLPRSAALEAEGRAVVKVAGATLPLIPLADMLGAPPDENPPPDDDLRVAVLNASDRQVAFLVDELLSERELVLKPLGPELRGARYVSGAALLGSGEVVVVLDANELVRGAVGAPLPPRRATPADLAEADPEPAALRVLIADDSITTRTLEKNILENAGCDVRVAFDGLQAWETLNEHVFDVIISDVEMPRMNGLELTRRVKATPATRHIPVILLTSLNKPEHQAAGLEAGADAYLIKSQFDQDELLLAVQRVL
ncbi:MAG: hybrid sensor histidine kinase/response regulator [Chloroflexota bacterium]